MTTFKEQLLEAKTKRDFAEQEYQRLRASCKHELLPVLTDRMKAELRKASYASWKYGTASCDICREGFGHRCPDSPDTVCHYFSDDGFVELITGVKVAVGDPDSDNETEDSCLYCGYPLERK